MSTLDYVIREATESDAEGIAAVHVNSWQTSYRGIIDQSFLDNISYEDRLALRREILQTKKVLHLVALFGDQIVGFAGAGPIRSESRVDQHPLFKNASTCIGEIYAIYLLEEHKGKGCGKALFSTSRNWLDRQGFESFVVRALTDNVRARRFYESQGGTLIGEMTIKIHDKDYQEVCYFFRIRAS
ncbi:MAG TPA: GNAT family N-acetyltransferase [Alphaproteobacteria bacterium]|nr:GNAT family N-acetyltransferase [Alphaproteobacteria bacterium]